MNPLDRFVLDFPFSLIIVRKAERQTRRLFFVLVDKQTQKAKDRGSKIGRTSDRKNALFKGLISSFSLKKACFCLLL